MGDDEKTQKLLDLLRERDAECIAMIGHLMHPNEVSIYRLAVDEIERLRAAISKAGV